ncbi:hypothetical protein HN695_02030 [Candidatus Woesearchaeota archaeon]|jgi:hypothetical protein|nr:hypothetical protein [Candidatus Woesearchaeota archaeon]MBT5273177.1 hypothetical protein [Candidatus Woesearchaeota archaeon]MBT6041204.1 hypothetical protein [Candidatus Woesearchaeota archaeon]MBT6337508.1 hypothetical protein [Candidatus Woesearchaeota archaeon]MBT7927091.1 hypothetical protein [Candidatus Woesearchaeota archaeon]
MTKKEEVKTNKSEACNLCCMKCLKWDQFKEECWSHWHGKKECSQMVENQDDWDYEKLLLKE